MRWLKDTFPILWSPQFWGIVITAFFHYCLAKGWIGTLEATLLRDIAAAATLVGFGNKVAKKIGGTVTANIDTVEKVSVTPTEPA